MRLIHWNTPTGTLAVDKGAAKRFITAALSQAISQPTASSSSTRPAPTSTAVLNESATDGPKPLEAHLYKSAKQLERDRLLQEPDSSDDDEDIEMVTDVLPAPIPAPPKSEPPSHSQPSLEGKRRRPVMDPFEGKPLPVCHLSSEDSVDVVQAMTSQANLQAG